MHSIERPICELDAAIEMIGQVTRTIYNPVDCLNCLRQAIAEAEEKARVLRELLGPVEARS
jgi:hypothetical protein